MRKLIGICLLFSIFFTFGGCSTSDIKNTEETINKEIEENFEDSFYYDKIDTNDSSMLAENLVLDESIQKILSNNLKKIITKKNLIVPNFRLKRIGF